MTGETERHPAFGRMFGDGGLSLGFVLPVASPPDRPVDWREQLALAALADRLGFAGLWVRDVPLNSPAYPDPIGHSDPWTLLGALAARTERIALLTGAVVLPLRHPLHVAKAALSVDALSGGRFLLGLGAGDRAFEFAAFGRDRETRRDIFRDGWRRVAAALGPEAAVIPDIAGEETVRLEMRPRPLFGRIPMLAVGSAAQPLEWIARNAAGWATYHRPFPAQRDRIGLWKAAVTKAGGPFRGFSQTMALDLREDPHAPAEEIELGYRLGRNALVDALHGLRAIGVHHVMFNLSRTSRPAAEVMEELACEVMPGLATS
ncbi:TIGR03571 family LLM class oxidoreductase [Azospirillum sp. SYSU D00513]|uniref:TIGR03571 family LLM class oxidoreductase n=1 Tax=Azospirillum sp. SYSU D00513 TaxID=2812561 RepID=UPI001A96B240|nr:TIGR03571 family LLM class oxidoreductase [Azospirillum sp. SYSU D00513]